MKEPLTLSDRTYAAIVSLLVAAVLIALAIVEAIGSDGRHPAPSTSEGPWTDYIRAVDDALGANDARAAQWALGQAYTAALGSRRWDGLLAVGGAAARIGNLSRARMAYLTAAVRARQARSVDGVLQAAQAFAELGDRDVVERVLSMARDAAGHDVQSLAAVRAVSERLSERSASAEARP